MRARRERLAGLAGRQEGVVSIEQLYAIGFTADEVQGMLDRGELHRLHRGVYAVGHRRVGQRGWLRAALLASGDRAFLSHRTAAGLRGLCGLNTWDIHVTVPTRRANRRRGITAHWTRSPPHPSEVGTVGGLRVASVPLILIQLAATESREELDRMIELAFRKHKLEMPRMEAAIARHSGARGLAQLNAALAAYRPRPFDKSGLERSVAEAIAADPEIPPPERNVRYKVWELDFYWPGLRAALDVDGGDYHRLPGDVEKDKLKDMKLAVDGILMVRITEDRWLLDRSGALADLRAVLRTRRRAA